MLLLCLKIFFTRILDVSLGTFRTIVLIKGKNVLAGTIGFFEVFIWFVIVQEALNTINNSLWIAISYSLGFAAGTIIGGYITNYFIRTPISLQIITANDEMAGFLRDNGFSVTVLNAEGMEGNKQMLILETTDKLYKTLMKLIKKIDEQAFVVVDEKKYVHNGFFLHK